MIFTHFEVITVNAEFLWLETDRAEGLEAQCDEDACAIGAVLPPEEKEKALPLGTFSLTIPSCLL